MSNLIYAPWTDEQVAALNRWQDSDYVHPFMCGNDHGDNLSNTLGAVLVATTEGWKCLHKNCDYTQNWAHDFMLEPPPEHPMKKAMERYEKKTKRDKP